MMITRQWTNGNDPWRMRRLFLRGLLSVLLLQSAHTCDQRAAAGDQVKSKALAPQAMELSASLDNVHRLSPRIYSGSQPESSSSFVALKRLGIGTVVSVDGAPPRVEEARQHGLRYVHIPIGYDGIPQQAQLSITRVVWQCPGRIYIHCHHGRHRGPAVAAVACIVEGVVNAESASEILEQCGTSPAYEGLWRDVRGFRVPPSEVALPELVERAAVNSLVSDMVDIDSRFNRLLEAEAEGWRIRLDSEPAPAQDALLLKETLREASRRMTPRSNPIRSELREAAEIAAELEQALQAGATGEASHALPRLREACDRCHRQHRD